MGAPLRTIEPSNPMGPGDPGDPFSPVGPSKPYRVGRNEEMKVKYCLDGKFWWNQLTLFNYLLDANVKYEHSSSWHLISNTT